jgi:hypothetical protein
MRFWPNFVFIPIIIKDFSIRQCHDQNFSGRRDGQRRLFKGGF